MPCTSFEALHGTLSINVFIVMGSPHLSTMSKCGNGPNSTALNIMLEALCWTQFLHHNWFCILSATCNSQNVKVKVQ